MMHKKRKFISGLCVTAVLAASVFTPAVFAQNEQVGISGIRLWGNTECKESGHTVCIDVYAHGKSVVDLRSASSRSEYPDILVYRDEVKSGVEGAYEFAFGLGERASGIYDAYIACDCGEEIVEEEIIFSNSAENKIAIGLLNTAAKDNEGDAAVTEIKKVCSENKYALGFISDYALDSFAADLIDTYIDEIVAGGGEGLDVNDKESAIALFKKSVAISAVKSGAIGNLFDATEELQLSEGRLASLYTMDFVTSNFGTYITGKLKDQSFATIEAFDEALYKQFVFSTVKNADGYGNIQAVVSVFKNDIGLNREASSTECLKVMNKEYTTYPDLLAAMLAEGGSGGSGGSGGGGGGGGSSSGGSSSGGTVNGVGNGVLYSDDYTSANTTEKINKNIFDDIDGVSWATEAIVELAQKGIISGKGNRKFCPNDNITREEFIKIIMMTFFADAKAADITFADVDNSAWYAEYVKMAYGADIVKGVSDSHFGTGANITREDMAVIAYRTAQKAGKLNDEAEAALEFAFGDDGNIADYAKEAVYKLYGAEVINGMTASEFAPKQPLTRAQAAKIIYGIYTLR